MGVPQGEETMDTKGMKVLWLLSIRRIGKRKIRQTALVPVLESLRGHKAVAQVELRKLSKGWVCFFTKIQIRIFNPKTDISFLC